MMPTPTPTPTAAGAAGERRKLACAVLLIGGAMRTWRGSFGWTLVPLLVILVFGSFGKVIDLVGTDSDTQGKLIGAAILAATVVPIGLLSSGPARKFAASGRRRS
jgi:hypothetical protein